MMPSSSMPAGSAPAILLTTFDTFPRPTSSMLREPSITNSARRVCVLVVRIGGAATVTTVADQPSAIGCVCVHTTGSLPANERFASIWRSLSSSTNGAVAFAVTALPIVMPASVVPGPGVARTLPRHAVSLPVFARPGSTRRIAPP